MVLRTEEDLEEESWQSPLIALMWEGVSWTTPRDPADAGSAARDSIASCTLRTTTAMVKRGTLRQLLADDYETGVGEGDAAQVSAEEETEEDVQREIAEEKEEEREIAEEAREERAQAREERRERREQRQEMREAVEEVKEEVAEEQEEEAEAEAEAGAEEAKEEQEEMAEARDRRRNERERSERRTSRRGRKVSASLLAMTSVLRSPFKCKIRFVGILDHLCTLNTPVFPLQWRESFLCRR